MKLFYIWIEANFIDWFIHWDIFDIYVTSHAPPPCKHFELFSIISFDYVIQRACRLYVYSTTTFEWKVFHLFNAYLDSFVSLNGMLQTCIILSTGSMNVTCLHIFTSFTNKHVCDNEKILEIYIVDLSKELCLDFL